MYVDHHRLGCPCELNALWKKRLAYRTVRTAQEKEGLRSGVPDGNAG